MFIPEPLVTMICRVGLGMSIVGILLFLVPPPGSPQVTETGGDRVIDTDALPRDANGKPQFEGIPGFSEAREAAPEVRQRIQALREQSEEIQRSFAPDLPLLAVPDLPADETLTDSGLVEPDER